MYAPLWLCAQATLRKTNDLRPLYAELDNKKYQPGRAPQPTTDWSALYD